MLRTTAVELTTIPAAAFRIKTADGPSITIQRDDYKQPGIASISRTSGEPIPSKNTNLKKYPLEAFREAIEKTNGLPYKKMKGVKVEEGSISAKKTKAEKELEAEEIIVDSADYQKVVDKYTDKNGKLSYELLNKDFIKFAKSSSIVRDMAANGATVPQLRKYIYCNKIRNITGNQDLTDKQCERIVELLDETYPKGVFKELNEELRKMVSANKKKK